MTKQNLDERQLWIRGEVFKHCLILMGSLLLLNTFLIDSGIVLIEGIWANILIIAVTSSIANIEMTLKGAVNFDDKRMTFFSVIMGICGLAVIVFGIIHLINGEGIIVDNQLSKNGTFLIMASFFIAIPVSYYFKVKQFNKEITD